MSQRRARRRGGNLAEVEEFAAGLKEAFLYCRRFGHAYKPHTAKLSNEFRGYETTKRCTRCTLVVVEVMDMRGAIIKSWPRYPEGYLAKGIGRIVGEGKDIVRLETLNRFLVKPLRRVG